MIAGFFMMFWGVIFAGVPTFAILQIIAVDGFGFFVFPFLIFPIVGITVFIIGLKTVIKGLKLKRISYFGQDSIGHFISTNSNTKVNGSPLYYIVFSFTNNQGKEIHVKSQSKYNADEAQYFAQKKHFKIKFSGSSATIVEEPNLGALLTRNAHAQSSSTYNENTTSTPQNSWTYHDGKIVISPQKNYYYVCEYCGSSQKKLGKCKSCGAKVTESGKREEH